MIVGDALANVVEGRNGGDVILAGDGNDTIQEGASANGGDFIRGGAGMDFLYYDQRRNAVSVTFENRTDLANDGETGEGDNVMDDVDVVFGGRGDDTLTAARGGSALIGGPGIDRITGGPSTDTLDGGAGRDVIGGAGGNDFVYAYDGEPDITDCGSDSDVFFGDEARLDTAFGCEQVNRKSVGRFALSPRTRTVRAGRTAVVRLRWTHPIAWTRLDEVRLVFADRGRRVGTVRLDEQRRTLTATGLRLDRTRTAIRAAGPGARLVTLRLALRVPARLAGRTLTVKAGASDDGGARQAPRRAGAIRVAAR